MTKAMQPKHYLIFMDETGTISNNDTNQQPFFALGIIRLLDTSDLMAKSYTVPKNGREFKFARIFSRTDAIRAEKIINLCLKHRPFYFCCFIIEKAKINHRNKSIWELQVEFAKKHIEENCKKDYACVVADYVTKPNSVTETFEQSLRESSTVFNAFMVDSESSIFIQIVDLLIGAITYKYKIAVSNSNQKINKNKLRVAHFLERQLTKMQSNVSQGKKFPYSGKINEQFMISKQGFYFSVYEK